MNAKSEKDPQPLISVCIPTYEMHGLGAGFLKESLDILAAQTFKDFNVVISDHSKDDSIEKLCGHYGGRLDIKYRRNERMRGNIGANFNNMVNHADGKLIKMLMQDDFLLGKDSLGAIARAFDLGKDTWLVTACDHTKDGKTFFRPFMPYYNPKMHLGRNTISSPSVLTIINDDPLPFDEKVTWSADCDYYRRLHDRYGDPKVLGDVLVANRVGAHQVSNTHTNEKAQDDEFAYMARKHGERHPELLILARKARRIANRAKRSLKSIILKATKA